MGLSQGYAAGLISTLLGEGEAFGASVGMCGYLPFRRKMHDYVEDTSCEETDPLAGSGDESEDVFERDEHDTTRSGSNLEMAVAWLREELQAENWSADAQLYSVQSIPIFMGHGTEDEKVLCDFGRLAAEFLRSVDINVEWKKYEDLGH